MGAPADGATQQARAGSETARPSQRGGGDAAGNQTECLVAGSAATTVEAVVRFLHLTARQVGEINPPLAEGEIVTTGTLTRAMPVKSCETWSTALDGIALVILEGVRTGPSNSANVYNATRRQAERMPRYLRRPTSCNLFVTEVADTETLQICA